MNALVYAEVIVKLLDLAQQVREDAKRNGITDEALDEAIDNFDASHYRDPLHPLPNQ